MTSVGMLVIALLVGYIFHATMNRVAKVEHDYHEMMELKKRAEAADVAKSQVHYYDFLSLRLCLDFIGCVYTVLILNLSSTVVSCYCLP